MTANELAVKMERMRKRIQKLVADYDDLQAQFAAFKAQPEAPATATTTAAGAAGGAANETTTGAATEAAGGAATGAATEIATKSATAKESERTEEERKCPKKEEEKKEKEKEEENARELRLKAFRQSVEAATQQWPIEKRERFITYWSQPSTYKPRLFMFEMRGWDLQMKIDTWVEFANTNPLAMARARQAELARQREIQAEEERQRRAAEREQRLRQQREAFVPMPVLKAFEQAGLGNYRTMDKAAIIATLRQHAAATAATPLPGILAEYLSQNT